MVIKSTPTSSNGLTGSTYQCNFRWSWKTRSRMSVAVILSFFLLDPSLELCQLEAAASCTFCFPVMNNLVETLLITKVPRANNYVSELTHYLISTKVDLVTGIEAAYWLVRLSNFPGDGSSPGFHNFFENRKCCDLYIFIFNQKIICLVFGIWLNFGIVTIM